MKTQTLKKLVISALGDLKAKDVTTMDVRGLSGVTDFMIIATGTSNRHVKSLAYNVVDEAKKNDMRPIGVEGEADAEWILVDLGDVVVHVMLSDARSFYDLESLWSGGAPEASQ